MTLSELQKLSAATAELLRQTRIVASQMTHECVPGSLGTLCRRCQIERLIAEIEFFQPIPTPGSSPEGASCRGETC